MGLVKILSDNYGIAYSSPEHNGKMNLLFDQMLLDNWTEERCKQTVYWFIRNCKYPTWTVADWFSAPLSKLFPRGAYLKELDKNKSLNSEITWYDLDGTYLWSYEKDLPLPKMQQVKAKPVFKEPEMQTIGNPDMLKTAVENLTSNRNSATNRLSSLLPVQ